MQQNEISITGSQTSRASKTLEKKCDMALILESKKDMEPPTSLVLRMAKADILWLLKQLNRATNAMVLISVPDSKKSTNLLEPWDTS